MKLSELVTHTSTWLGIPRTIVESHARYLREASLLTSGARGLAAPDMSCDDKITLFISVCGVEVASRAAEYVSIWRKTFRTDRERYPHLGFAFLTSDDVSEMLANLMTRDLNGGPLDKWLAEAENPRAKAAKAHSITLDFYIDEFGLELVVSRNEFTIPQNGTKEGLKVTSLPIVVKFAPPPPPTKQPVPRSSDQFQAPSRLIRRLDAANIRGWGTCLLEQ